MRYVSISDAKNGLSALVREIRGGATVVITDRGVPVAKLAAISPSTGVSAGAIELAQRGRLEMQSQMRAVHEEGPTRRAAGSGCS